MQRIIAVSIPPLQNKLEWFKKITKWRNGGENTQYPFLFFYSRFPRIMSKERSASPHVKQEAKYREESSPSLAQEYQGIKLYEKEGYRI